MASHPSTPPSKRHRKNPSTRESAEKGGDGLHTSEKSPLVVFAHGAGAPSTSEWMIRFWVNPVFSLILVEFDGVFMRN
ncbi:hypothetical protein KSP39_PZI024366 [Platanthera zijinensis]|uniref:Uncharacterized protein n=1 Tax=Platanthera zijinensis TaxID=2320716 RepID=A0AAP0FTW8_9ASPA